MEESEEGPLASDTPVPVPADFVPPVMEPLGEGAGQLEQKPIISCLHKYVLYETKGRFYLVGCNDAETRFRVLKIDRTEPKELHIAEDTTEYSKVEVESLLNMIDHGNRYKSSSQKGFPGLNTTVSAFGIVGFVRFLEGYYIILITGRKKVAMIGGYSVYKIADTKMIYIPHPSVKPKQQHSDEAKYVKMFQNVDLSSNFYFSYSYDVTHSLQFNLSPVKPRGGILQQPTTPVTPSSDRSFGTGVQSECVVGVRVKPCDMFVWNWYLTSQLRGHVHGDWVLSVIHGFVGQSNICVYGKPIYLTLIARRSRLYAGTRYLKRGANYQGAVANEVEIEQILHEASHTSLHNGHSTSYTQLRGSVPAFWSQDVNSIIPKPPIQVDISDPFFYSAAQHFDRLLKRYGSPVIVLNLVKKNEKKKREEILTENLVPAVEFLNLFLPAEHVIKYMAFDMAHYNKRNKDVMRKLAKIGDEVVNMTGFFHSGPPAYCHTIRPNPRFSKIAQRSVDGVQKQVGVLRVNCVDCLDRTNTVQFTMGKCLLGLQLHALCVIDRLDIDFATDCVRMLEELYEQCGDTLALQYGGSQLVHRVSTYRKPAAFSTNSHDKMQSLSRYLSNAFSDWEKQSAINLFLGVYIPSQCKTSLWDLTTDYYLHQSLCLDMKQFILTSYTQWWDIRLRTCLPLPLEEVLKSAESVCETVLAQGYDERVSTFYHYHQPYQLSDFKRILLVAEHSQRDVMPQTAKDVSPFALRAAPRKRQPIDMLAQSAVSPRSTPRNPKSNPPDEGESSSGSGDDSSSDGQSECTMSIRNSCSSLKDHSLSSHFTTMKNVYGVEIQEPNTTDRQIYSRYVELGIASGVFEGDKRHHAIKQGSHLETPSVNMISTSSYEVNALTVRDHDLITYRNHVNVGLHGPVSPSYEDLSIYKAYTSI